VTDAEQHLQKARRAAERGDRMQVAWHLTQARGADADPAAVEAIEQEVTA